MKRLTLSNVVNITKHKRLGKVKALRKRLRRRPLTRGETLRPPAVNSSSPGSLSGTSSNFEAPRENTLTK